MQQRTTPLRARTMAVLLVVLALCAACGADDDGDGATTSPSSPTSTQSATSSTTLPATPPTTLPATPTSTSAPPAASTSTAPPVDTTTTVAAATTAPVEVDDEAPPAPVNVTCAPGGGSQEVQLEWDAPADPDDIVDVRLYLDEGSGFARVDKFTTDSGQVVMGSTRWSAVAYPVPVATPVRMAVTVGDAAGNESGWNPIDVYYEYSGADCPA